MYKRQDEELEANQIESFSSWKVLRPVCFSLIKGKKLPGSFHIVLLLPPSDTEKFAFASGSGISLSLIHISVANIKGIRSHHTVDQALHIVENLEHRAGKDAEDVYKRQTYNGDHMSMYGVNGSVPKTLVRHLVRYYADTCNEKELADVLLDVLDTPCLLYTSRCV